MDPIKKFFFHRSRNNFIRQMHNIPSDGLSSDSQYVQLEVGADDQQFIVYTDWAST